MRSALGKGLRSCPVELVARPGLATDASDEGRELARRLGPVAAHEWEPQRAVSPWDRGPMVPLCAGKLVHAGRRSGEAG
jgi:hypothetical protein